LFGHTHLFGQFHEYLCGVRGRVDRRKGALKGRVDVEKPF
jgi:hypothetical protein